jgi:small subunit ribosomal protein S21
LKHKFKQHNNQKAQKQFKEESFKLTGLTVQVRDGDFNYALRKFKKKVQESGIMQDLREKEFYEKPSATRKKAKASARARWLKKLRNDPVNQIRNRNKR